MNSLNTVPLYQGLTFCNSCKQYLQESDFGKNSQNKSGKFYKCKTCVNATSKKYRDTHPERVLENAKKYRGNRQKDQHVRLLSLINVSRQRARNKGLEHTLTYDQLKKIFPKDGKCPVFGFDLEWNSAGFRETSPSIDRIDSSLGYTIDNVQIISWKANRIKSYATVEEIETVLNYMKSGG